MCRSEVRLWFAWTMSLGCAERMNGCDGRSISVSVFQQKMYGRYVDCRKGYGRETGGGGLIFC